MPATDGPEGTEEQSEGSFGYTIPGKLLEAAERRYRSAFAGGRSDTSICVKLIDTVVEYLGIQEQMTRRARLEASRPDDTQDDR